MVKWSVVQSKEEMTPTMVSYILSVTGAKSIAEVEFADIKSFFEMLEATSEATFSYE